MDLFIELNSINSFDNFVKLSFNKKFLQKANSFVKNNNIKFTAKEFITLYAIAKFPDIVADSADIDNSIIIEKCNNFGNDQVMLCERGTSFGYDNLIVDMLGMSKLKSFNCPVVFDVTHSLQLPGQGKTAAGGRGDQAEYLAKAGVSLGIAGLFIEVHPNPEKALCDGPSATPLHEFESLLEKVNAVDQAVKGL